MNKSKQTKSALKISIIRSTSAILSERKMVSTEITFCNLPIYFLKWQDLINVNLKTSKNDPSAFVTAAELGNMETIK